MGLMWTPWRMKFILSEKKAGECIFCEEPEDSRDRENYILYRGRWCYIILNAYPYNNGHLLIVPYSHTCELELLAPEVVAEMMSLVQRSVAALKKAMNPDGFNIGMNLGRAAGAGIADHLHMHVVPRWVGDTNFMPVISDTRMIPELLTETYDRLLAAGIAHPLAEAGRDDSSNTSGRQ